MLTGGKSTGSFESSIGIPEGLDRIYLMAQVNVDEDIICGRKNYKKIE